MSEDASAADGGVDPAPDARTAGMVTVRVFVANEPAEDVAVMVHDVDGAYLRSMLTDANGEVAIDDMPVGGAVTAPVTPFFGSSPTSENILSTVTDVQHGDTIVFGQSRLFDSGVTVGSLAVDLPSTAIGGATRYRAYAGCRSRSATSVDTQLMPSLEDNCVGSDDQVDVVAYAEDADGRLAYSAAIDVPLSGTRPDLTGSASLPAWDNDLASYAFTATNPFQAGELETIFLGFRDGLQIDDDNGGVSLTEGGSASMEFDFADGVFDRALIGMATQVGPADGAATTVLVDSTGTVPTAASPGDLSVDVAEEMYGLVENVAVVDGDPLGVSFSKPSPFSCKGNSDPDSLIWSIRGEMPAATGVAAPTYTWMVLSPGDTSSGVTLPELDPGLAQTLWPASSFSVTEGSVAFVADSALSYDDLRTSEQNFGFFDIVPGGDDATRCLLLTGLFLLN